MEQPLGRRERNKADKLARILAAANHLFTEKGYSATTTAEISDMADIAQGTLFRYAATKAELMLMVYNSNLREAIAVGERGRSEALPDRIMDFMKPLMQIAGKRLENSAIYQRELLFGDMTEPNRAEGVMLVTRLEDAMEQVLLASLDVDPDAVEPLQEHRQSEKDSPATAAARATLNDPDDAYRMAHALFSQFYVSCANASLRNRPLDEALYELECQVRTILSGWPQRATS